MRLIPEDHYFADSFLATVEQENCIPPETGTIHYLAEIGICRFGKPGVLQVSPAVSVYPDPGKAHGDGGSVRTHCQTRRLVEQSVFLYSHPQCDTRPQCRLLRRNPAFWPKEIAQ
jgi:hypothetical protein